MKKLIVIGEQKLDRQTEVYSFFKRSETQNREMLKFIQV